MRIINTFILFIFTFSVLKSQSVGIGTNTPNTSAILDISSTSKGLLLPRMTTAQRDAIAAPAEGLQIFNTEDKCTDMYNGTAWIKNCGYKESGTMTKMVWTPIASFPDGYRSEGFSFSINGKGYIGCGRSQNGTEKKDFWQYDPQTNIWSQKADFVGERYSTIGFSIGAFGYAGTGIGNPPPFGIKSDFWKYDPVSNNWTVQASMPVPREAGIGFNSTSNGFAGLGKSGNVQIRDFYKFTPNATYGTWTTLANYPGSTTEHGIGIYNGYNHAFVGFCFNDSLYKFNINTNQWQSYGYSMGLGSIDNALTFKINNYLYFGGGSARSDFYRSSIDASGNIGTAIIIPNFPVEYNYQKVDGAAFVIQNKAYVGGIGQGGGGKFYSFNPDSIVPILSLSNPASFTEDAYWKLINGGTSSSFTLKNKSKFDIEFWGEFTEPLNCNYLNLNASYSSILFKSNSLSNRKIILWDNDGGSNFYGFGISSNTLRYNVPINEKHSFFSGSNLLLTVSGITNGTTGGRMQFANVVDHKKITLYDSNGNDHQYYGIGVESGTLRYQVSGTGAAHKFFAGSSAASSNNLFNIFGDGNIQMIGSTATKPGGGTWTAPSDERIKENVKDYTTGLDQILKIRPVTFQYNGKGNTFKDNKQYVGVIAQEIEKVFPNTVSKIITDDFSDLRSFDASELTFALINAIKELKIENDKLKERIAIIEGKLK